MLGWCAAMRFLSARLAFGLCLSLRRWRGVWLSVRPALRFYRRVLPRFTPAVCRIAPNRTACDSLRFYSAGRDRHLCVLAALAWLSALAGSLRVCAFICGDPDGLPGRGERSCGERELAAQHLCIFAQSHWPCKSFRGEYVGATRPKPAPKSLRLSGLSSRCGGVALVRIRSACASLRSRIGFAAFSAGSTLGLRAPDCAKESSTLWTLFRGWSSERVRFTRRGCVGSNIHPCKKRQRPNHRTHARKTRVHGKT